MRESTLAQLWGRRLCAMRRLDIPKRFCSVASMQLQLLQLLQLLLLLLLLLLLWLTVPQLHTNHRTRWHTLQLQRRRTRPPHCPKQQRPSQPAPNSRTPRHASAWPAAKCGMRCSSIGLAAPRRCNWIAQVTQKARGEYRV